MIMNRISGCNGEELENLELRFDIFQQNIASHPVVQVEFILWLYHVKLQIDDERILSLKFLMMAMSCFHSRFHLVLKLILYILHHFHVELYQQILALI